MATTRSEFDRCFTGYVRQTVKLTHLGYLRRLWRLSKHELLVDDQAFAELIAPDEFSDENSPESFHDPRLYAAVKRLTPVQYQILRLVVFYGYSQEEVAVRLGCVQTTVSRRLRKALDELKEVMNGDPT